jgi:hypothetical protein
MASQGEQGNESLRRADTAGFCCGSATCPLATAAAALPMHAGRQQASACGVGPSKDLAGARLAYSFAVTVLWLKKTPIASLRRVYYALISICDNLYYYL